MFFGFAAIILFASSVGAQAAKFTGEAAELARLTHTINESYIGRGDPGPTAALATDNYRFVLFNGSIESKDQVVSTIGGLKTTSFEEEIQSVDITGNTGIVISQFIAPGTLNGRPALATPTRSLMVWSRVDGNWRLVSQALHVMRPLQDMLAEAAK
jgi:hypothetical protein